ncbi:thioesterase family protein [Oceaniglobus ichthyenteri]|uniref:thioesterase family protein n=1 Tax=Oceaniglobus ichthyenteri TaxID=2136177 RepID=UPI000D378EF2|nr:thioesterase family protein [Oceaniglobus ichthyenteri]
MYPVIRLAKELLVHRNAPPLGLFETHVSHHICWPQDIDVWREMNNGRTLTLYDLGRFALFQRTGAIKVMRAERWAGTVAGSSVRYRRRVRMFHRFEMRTRILGWDARFLYMEQSMWRNGDCTSNALFRTAVTGQQGLVPMAEAAAALGVDPVSPPLPDWVAAWTMAEAQRPWPPLT